MPWRPAFVSTSRLIDRDGPCRSRSPVAPVCCLLRPVSSCSGRSAPRASRSQRGPPASVLRPDRIVGFVPPRLRTANPTRRVTSPCWVGRMTKPGRFLARAEGPHGAAMLASGRPNARLPWHERVPPCPRIGDAAVTRSPRPIEVGADSTSPVDESHAVGQVAIVARDHVPVPAAFVVVGLREGSASDGPIPVSAADPQRRSHRL